MIKPTKRKAFNFLRSYFDVLNELENDKDRLNFLLSIINKQFLDESPKGLNFIVNLCYESQRHAIETSVNGWKRASNDTLSTNPPLNPPTNPKEEEEEEEEKVEVIDFKSLVDFINKVGNRSFNSINNKAKDKYRSRIKEGYTKDDIHKAITNAYQDDYHKETNFKYLTPEFFSRPEKLDLHSVTKLIKSKNNNPTINREDFFD